MRMDLFLKLSRLASGRTAAKELCDEGAVFVNGITAKSSKDVRIGDRIEVRRWNRIMIVSVEQVPGKKQVPRSEANSLYTVISDEKLNPESGLSA